MTRRSLFGSGNKRDGLLSGEYLVNRASVRACASAVSRRQKLARLLHSLNLTFDKPPKWRDWPFAQSELMRLLSAASPPSLKWNSPGPFADCLGKQRIEVIAGLLREPDCVGSPIRWRLLAHDELMRFKNFDPPHRSRH